MPSTLLAGDPQHQNICPCSVIQIVPNKSGADSVAEVHSSGGIVPFNVRVLGLQLSTSSRPIVRPRIRCPDHSIRGSVIHSRVRRLRCRLVIAAAIIGPLGAREGGRTTKSAIITACTLTPFVSCRFVVLENPGMRFCSAMQVISGGSHFIKPLSLTAISLTRT